MSNAASGVARSNRSLMMLSGINRAAIRADSPDGLYRDACRVAVECGLFRCAWIGLVDDINGCVRMLACHGETDRTPEPAARDDALAAHVLRTGQLAVFNDLSALPQDMDGAELARRGYRAIAAMPLQEGDKTAGVFMLYAGQEGCFDDDVVQMLREVGDDIAFSLGHMLSEQQRMAAESKLYYMAFYDAQTGLPNRALLDERLPVLAKRGRGVTLLDIRLHRLDRALHLFGRLAMDDVLRMLAARLEACRVGDGFVAQLGQDEFAFVLPEAAEPASLGRHAHALLSALEEPVRLGDKEVFLRASIGAAVYPLHEADIAHLLRRARAAADRDAGDGGFRIYSRDIDRGLELRARTEAELHRALERGEFSLHYQPQLSLRSGAMVGVEALLQWRHPQRGLVGPGGFVPLLEDCGLMPAVGAWVLRQACRQARQWQEQGLPPLRMGVNLSALQFRLADLPALVRSALEEAELDPAWLELELTESLILENVEQTIAAMHELKALGLSLSLDDFGTGYSSLSYLRRYPVDRIKIDQSFIREMNVHAGSAALVRSILALAHHLGLQTIAEGVETMDQFEYLRKQPCDEMQGFLFSRAVPPEDIAHMLAQGRRLQSRQAAAVERHAILLVGTDPRVLALQEALSRADWQVLRACSADEALSLLAADAIAVVISGLETADADDTSFLHRVRMMYPRTVRILLTAGTDAGLVMDAVNCGEIYRVLAEPVEEGQLLGCVRDAYRRFAMQAS
ncbi:MAG TPA: EAL domain-containing protein [Noviherbaspirillum sp.]|uniref:EAL domain-containing protein n=1 Tax=Noviherbaspirillum sp. TaxID=1926288 RepID=UPI002D26CF72|nr:EAL domain-containing protein [Noviherbaspirillum sp.]HYD97377.1 EAL domain-containing protein [Noviherbaspirillum sp.]